MENADFASSSWYVCLIKATFVAQNGPLGFDRLKTHKSLFDLLTGPRSILCCLVPRNSDLYLFYSSLINGELYLYFCLG